MYLRREEVLTKKDKKYCFYFFFGRRKQNKNIMCMYCTTKQNQTKTLNTHSRAHSYALALSLFPSLFLSAVAQLALKITCRRNVLLNRVFLLLRLKISCNLPLRHTFFNCSCLPFLYLFFAFFSFLSSCCKSKLWVFFVLNLNISL